MIWLKKILWAGIEDYSGLWEIYWEFNSTYPDLSEDQKSKAIQKRIADLIEHNYLALYWCKEPYGELTNLSNAEVRNLLLTPLSFKTPDKEAYSLRLKTTSQGEEHLKVNH